LVAFADGSCGLRTVQNFEEPTGLSMDLREEALLLEEVVDEEEETTWVFSLVKDDIVVVV
jgi:hypothetical protein